MGKHAIYFYKDKSGKEPVLEYLKELLSQNGKDSRIKAFQNSGLYQYVERTQHKNRRTVHKAY